MPRCWFVLLRFWLRVDGVLVRLRETRLCCDFGQPERPAGTSKLCTHLMLAAVPCSSVLCWLCRLRFRGSGDQGAALVRGNA